MEQEQLLLEKYFPKSWEDVKLPTRVKNLLTEMQTTPGYRLLLHSSPGTGKCLGKDTKILMFDGSIKNVQDIVVGDVLMGPDSKPRNVLSICTGREEMFEIKPAKGKVWTCNKSHILSLVESGVWKDYKFGNTINPMFIEDMSINNVLNLPINHRKKLFQVPLNFEEQELKIPPYILGFWLGDGISREASVSVAKIDYPILSKIFYKYAEKIGMYITETSKESSCSVLRFVQNQKYTDSEGNLHQNNGENKLKRLMDSMNLIRNKHIPKEYLLNSRKNRLLLFAGYVDSDGGGNTRDCTYDFTIKQDELADNIEWLAHSLGYHVNRSTKFVKKLNGKEINKTYHRIQISGDFTDLNQYILLERKRFTRKINKNPLVNGFTIKSIGEGDYYGFEIDGDKRFLLGDFTVTHNTTSARLMVSDPSKYEVLYLSGSNDFKIDTLRGKVMTFASGLSVMSKHKVVIIDECENIRNDLQDAMKILLDQCKSVSFIFITNEVEKVNTAIQSRCTKIEYDFGGGDLQEQQSNFIKYAVQICKENNIEYENSAIKYLYQTLFPDFRHLIVTIQQLKDSNLPITLDNVKGISDSGKQNLELYDVIMDQSKTGRVFYETISKMKGKERECLISLGEPFFRFLNEKNLFEKTLQVAVIVSKYSDQYVTSINKFVTLLSCCNELKTIFK